MTINRVQNIIVLILICLFGVYYVFNNSTISSPYKRRMLENEFNGIVVEKYEDKKNRRTLTYKFDNGGDKLYSLPSIWDDKIEVGDSVIKKENELKILVKKKNGNLFLFDYNDFLNKLDEVGYFSKTILKK